ncbi:hypothetical protein ACSYDW_03335 [Paeniglutamicibacter sp. R2-26]|uniref:hypothetical protein n=1 Tax=Paeniglutamicibacter sp. R2-26 TaxID=3144417 RepID=UPI003EE77D54
MGKHSEDGAISGSGWWRSFIDGFLACVVWCVLALLAVRNCVHAFMKRIQGRLWRIRRPLRWVISGALMCLMFFIPVAIANELIRMHARDVAIVRTQNAEQGTLLAEDPQECSMSIELHGETIDAETSCHLDSSFPVGTTVAVVQDPESPERVLVVAPGQEWQEYGAFETWLGIAFGAFFGLMVFLICYRVLLLDDRPAVTKPRRPTTLADGAPGRARREGPRSPVDRMEKWWESKKAALVQWWTAFIDTDVRFRGPIMSACVIALSLGFLALNLSMNEHLGRDRQIVNYGTTVQVTLLDYTDDGKNPFVRHETAMVELAYSLRDAGSHEPGDQIAVVVDPTDPERLIPAEIAEEPGAMDKALDALPMVLAWLVAVGVLAAALIPNEMVALWQVVVDFVRKDGPENA